MKYALLNLGDEHSITVLDLDGGPFVARSDHPNFDQIVEAVQSENPDPEQVAELFDTALAAAKRFKQLSERVTVRNGVVYLDNDEIDNSLTKQIVRFLDQDVEDWQPLVSFFEKVQANPNEHSREQLYGWLEANDDVSITEDGLIVGYKGVQSDGKGGYLSTRSGPAVVDGEPHKSGQVPNNIGSVVEMARSEVRHDPSVTCSTGLHVATHGYASGSAFGSTDAVLEIHVNPRDVVSVPRDHGQSKVRTCRYTVIGEKNDGPYTEAVVRKDALIGRVFDLFSERWRVTEFRRVQVGDSWVAYLPSREDVSNAIDNGTIAAVLTCATVSDEQANGERAIVEAV